MDNNNMMNNEFESQIYQQPVNVPPEKQSNTKDILALVFGILAIVLSCCCTYLGIICGIVGIVMAVLAKNDKGQFSGMALAGLICGIIGIVISVVSIILVLGGIISTDELTDIITNM